MGHPQPLFVCVRCFQTNNTILQQINAEMSIQYPAPEFELTTFRLWVCSFNHSTALQWIVWQARICYIFMFLLFHFGRHQNAFGARSLHLKSHLKIQDWKTFIFCFKDIKFRNDGLLVAVQARTRSRSARESHQALHDRVFGKGQPRKIVLGFRRKRLLHLVEAWRDSLLGLVFEWSIWRANECAAQWWSRRHRRRTESVHVLGLFPWRHAESSGKVD